MSAVGAVLRLGAGREKRTARAEVWKRGALAMSLQRRGSGVPSIVALLHLLAP